MSASRPLSVTHAETDTPAVPYVHLGLIGLGQMGLPIARNLLAAGYRISAFNRTASRADELIARGARSVASAALAAEDADVVVTMVSDDAALESLTFGAGSMLDGMGPDAIHVSMSTISVVLAERLAVAHAGRGQRFVSAPVFGRPDAATSRELAIVAAGESGAVARCMPLFDAIGRRTFVVGAEPSRANVVKLIGNFLLASMLESLGESMALGRRYGLAPRALIDVVTEALFPCVVYRSYGARIASDHFTPAGLRLALGLKDVQLVLAAADRMAVPMPIAGVVRDRMLAGVASGMGEWDWASLARVAAERAGL